MATLTIAGLESLLHALDVKTPVPRFPSADIVSNPVDIYRSYIADAIQELTACDKEVAYDAIQWTTFAHGDLTLVAPRLKIKGIKPNELASDIASRVRT